LIGSAAVAALEGAGWETVLLSRKGGQGRIAWDPTAGELDPSSLEGFDAVVHLAGEPIAERWTADKKRKIRESRVQGTRLLVDKLGQTQRPPAVFLCASGINFYGNQPAGELTEERSNGEGFLADVTREWEAEAQRAQEHGMRVVCLRIAMVLSAKGGALAQMLPIFRKGLGGSAGGGQQQVSWIHLDDLARAIRFCLEEQAISGAVNACAPHPVSNKVFSEALGQALHRPAVMPVPKFALRTLFGEMANETILASQKAIPAKLQAHGFSFTHPQIQQALAAELA